MADERGYYYRYLGMLPNLFEKGLREKSLPAQMGMQARAASPVFLACNIGVFGYYARQSIEIVDPLALADPLLSRLPAREGARVGHYERALPRGYIESLVGGENRIEDPSLAQLWALVATVTRGELFSFNRLRAIYELNVHGRELVRMADYDRNDLHLPGESGGSRAMLSCLGQEYGPFIWPLLNGEAGVAVAHFSAR
jgi:arabinofuranosyltransferase